MPGVAIRAFSYLLAPTAGQADRLGRLLDAQRELYNAALEERRGAWRWERRRVSRYDQYRTLTGLREVPPEVRDAARGMGMGPTQSLLRVELPLAAPAIIAGLRIATVTVISLATVAALIDNEGLGVPILTAISNEVFKTELIVAGGMAVALAIGADALLVLAQRLMTPWTRARS